MDIARRVAPADIPILILGESGVDTATILIFDPANNSASKTTTVVVF
jgi:hypothetical protein